MGFNDVFGTYDYTGVICFIVTFFVYWVVDRLMHQSHVVPETWTTILQKQNELGIISGKRCLIMSKMKYKVTPKKIKEYFEDVRLSGGGSVRNIVEMNDGYLVEFDDEYVVSRITADNSFLQAIDHDQYPTVHACTVPGFSDDRIILKNVPDSYDEEALCIFLENHDTPAGRAPHLILKGDAWGRYAAFYPPELGVDVRKVIRNITVRGLKSKSFFNFTDGQVITASRAAPTNCVRLQGDILKLLSIDQIRLYMENEHRSGGGNVTWVERRKSSGNEVLVYFADSLIADRVWLKYCSNGKKLNLKDVPVDLTLYYHELHSKKHDPSTSANPTQLERRRSNGQHRAWGQRHPEPNWLLTWDQKGPKSILKKPETAKHDAFRMPRSLMAELRSLRRE